MFSRLKHYIDGILKGKRRLSSDERFLQSGEYVSITSLQEHCIKRGISLETFLKITEVLLAGEDIKELRIFFPEISRAIEEIRKETGISMRSLSRMLDTDRANLYRILRWRKTQKSCSLFFLIKLAAALGVSPSYIVEKARFIKEEDEKKETEDEDEDEIE